MSKPPEKPYASLLGLQKFSSFFSSTARWIQNGGDLFTIPARCPTCRKLLRDSGLAGTYINILLRSKSSEITALFLFIKLNLFFSGRKNYFATFPLATIQVFQLLPLGCTKNIM